MGVVSRDRGLSIERLRATLVSRGRSRAWRMALAGSRAPRFPKNSVGKSDCLGGQSFVFALRLSIRRDVAQPAVSTRPQEASARQAPRTPPIIDAGLEQDINGRSNRRDAMQPHSAPMTSAVQEGPAYVNQQSEHHRTRAQTPDGEVQASRHSDLRE